MAKRRRRRKTKSSTSQNGQSESSRTRKKKGTPIHTNECVDGLDPPNQLVPVCDRDDCDELGYYFRWPLVLCHQWDEQAESRLAAVFVEPRWHQALGSYQWKDHPPTWMDPHTMLEWAWQDPRVQELCEKAFKSNRQEDWKKLAPLLAEIFETKYLPHIIYKFEEEAKPLMAQWLLRKYAYQQTEPK